MTAIVRLSVDGREHWAVERAARFFALPRSLDELLSGSVAELRAAVEAADQPVTGAPTLLTPLQSQEIWAAGVTYSRSRDGRAEESGFAACYSAVYDAPRPELFFKALPWRVVADGDDIGIRCDSDWDVPEPELALVVTAGGDIAGYLVGNDVSSRTIEGANPLYLPQAKVYSRSCSISSRIVPVWEIDASAVSIALTVNRDDSTVLQASTTTAAMRRAPADLARWLVAALEFPHGAVLLTGTGIVPPPEFTLQVGDVVVITIDGVGTLSNTVVRVGRTVEPSGPSREST